MNEISLSRKAMALAIGGKPTDIPNCPGAYHVSPSDFASSCYKGVLKEIAPELKKLARPSFASKGTLFFTGGALNTQAVSVRAAIWLTAGHPALIVPKCDSSEAQKGATEHAGEHFLNWSQICVYGHGKGCQHAIGAALKLGDRVRTLVLEALPDDSVVPARLSSLIVLKSDGWWKKEEALEVVRTSSSRKVAL